MTRNSSAKRRSCRPARRGFTIVELLIVVFIGGVLMALAMPAFRQYTNQRNVINARHAFMMSASRARAAAVERGEPVVLMVRIYRDSVFVMGSGGADTLEMVDYRGGDIRANILLNGTPAPFRLCYMPRGFVHPSCEHGEYLDGELDIGFTNWSGTDTAWAVISAAGQVRPK